VPNVYYFIYQNVILITPSKKNQSRFIMVRYGNEGGSRWSGFENLRRSVAPKKCAFVPTGQFAEKIETLRAAHIFLDESSIETEHIFL